MQNHGDEGRPQMTKDDIPQIFYRHYPAFVKGELNVSELARVCGLSRNTVYKYVGLLEIKTTSETGGIHKP